MRRAEAFSRRRSATSPAAPAVMLDGEELELIDRLVRHDRTAVSTALLVIGGIGAGQASRRAVLAAVDEAVRRARADGAIGSSRADQIARHVKRALDPADQALAA
jgi:hypothetical protein